MNKIVLITLLTAMLAACGQKQIPYDASGTFEAVETIISTEASGTIKELGIEEGQELKAGQFVGSIDSLQLVLKKKQLNAQVNALLSRKPDISSQTAALQEQLVQAEREQKRISNLLKADAATPKQLDDANTLIDVLKKQINAVQSSLTISSESINEDVIPLAIQVQQVNDQLQKCRIINPLNGTVLTKYAEVNEVIAAGKPLYKIGDLTSIILRAYITGNQISQVKTGQKVSVLVDAAKDAYNSYPGTIEWISSKAEFTPKTIQTKDERANLVYAVKIRVKNDGYLKIGMYGEVKL